MKIAYNSNGWRGKPIETIVHSLARLGYDAVELSPQHSELAPESWTPQNAHRIKALTASAGLAICNLHVGAKDLLANRISHAPSLISLLAADRARRLDLNRRAIDFAVELGTDLVCLTSGAPPDRASITDCWERLSDGVAECLAYARERRIRIAIEPEPELFINTCSGFLALHQRLGTPAGLGLNLDIGHAQVVYEDIPAIIRELAPLIWHVHIEDIAGRVHRHLVPGQGEVDFHGIGKTLAETGYTGAASIKLMDHSHQAEAVARHAIAVLRTWRRPASAV